MENKPKVLFWLNGFFLHFSLAYYLQKKMNAEFYGIIDINSKPKKFFEEQKFVEFKKKWFYQDYLKNETTSLDLDYLSNFEKKYEMNLWEMALNERFFYLHNRFYKFNKEEILSILEDEIKLFETIIDEVKPDYFLTYNPVFHHQKLLLEMCRKRGIRVLSLCGATVKNLSIIAEDGGTFDLEPNIMSESSYMLASQERKENNEKGKDEYNFDFQNYLSRRSPSFLKKLSALNDYMRTVDSELVNSNFMYYGRSKFKVIKDALLLEFNKKNRYNFLQKFTTHSPKLDIPFVYFPMNVDEELNLLHYAPHYTNQIEVITHVAKSIPINYKLYVKDHIASKLRGWKSIDYYKQLMDIPNVVLVNPEFDNDLLVKNSKLIITIRGTSALKAVKFGKPSIIFGEEPFQVIPSVFRVDTLLTLPELINKSLNSNVNKNNYEKYEKNLNDRTFEFNIYEYENRRDETFFSGGIFSNVIISEQDMKGFLNNNEKMFSEIIHAHLKIMTDH